MSKGRNPREYFEYYENFKGKVKEIEDASRNAETVNPNEAAQSLLEIVEGSLKDSAASFDDKKNILEGFAGIISENTKKQNDLLESDKIAVQSEVFDKFAEKLEESILEESIQDDETPTKIFQKYKEQLQEIVTAIKPQERAQDIFYLSEEEKIPLELDNSSLDIPSFSVDDLNVDPITQAIRTRILAKQREIIAGALVTNNIVKPEELDDLNKFRAYFENEQNKETISELLKKDGNLKHALEQVEISGYKNIHTQFAGRFSTMEWNDGIVENANGITTKNQIVRDADGREIATLSEATHKINPPHTVQKSDGTNVTINNYRTIDFPIKLESNGPMHLSLAVKDQNGRNIAASNAVYFTAHYDDDGKLVEVSSPHPVKFTGDGPDAVGYIEHGGKIYTLPVTQEKYKAMMQEVAKNLGQGVDISPSIESIEASDLAVTSRGATPEVGYKFAEQKPVMQENIVMTQEVSKNLEHSMDVLPSIDAPSYMNLEPSRPNIEETQSQPHKVQETTLLSNDMVKMESVPDILQYPSEKVNVVIEEKATETSQAVLINRAEVIKSSLLRGQHISTQTRKTDTEIAELVRNTSKSLDSKGFEEQEKHVRTALKELSTPQEKIKLLEGVLKTTAEQRGKEINKIYTRDRKPDIDAVRLLTENKGRGKEGGIVKPQQKAEHANIKDDVKLQKFLRDEINKINEGPKKPIIAHKTRGAGGYSV